MNIYRHGDLLIKEIKELPKTIKKIAQGNSFVLAEGETTGHKHILISNETKTGFEVYQDVNGSFVLDLKANAEVSHEEHKTIKIKKGIYFVETEREYNWFEKAIKKVVD
jgi:hypothetical protein